MSFNNDNQNNNFNIKNNNNNNNNLKFSSNSFNNYNDINHKINFEDPYGIYQDNNILNCINNSNTILHLNSNNSNRSSNNDNNNNDNHSICNINSTLPLNNSIYNINNNNNSNNSNNENINNNNNSLIISSSLGSILKDIADDQLTEEQISRIKMIKNEILLLTKGFNNNNCINISTYNSNNNSNNSNYNNNNRIDISASQLEEQVQKEDEYYDDDEDEDDEEDYDEDDEDNEEKIEKEYIKSPVYSDNDLSFEQIKELISIIESTPKLYNKEWALVNQSWYSQWEKGIFSKDYLGPIDNYPLLDITDDNNELLRYDIKENQDFVAVPIEVWKVFKDIYGGSPDIIRKVTDRHDIDFKIPIILFLIKSSDINQCSQITKCHIFQYETFFSLKKRASQLFNLSFSDFDIYNFDGGIATQELYLFLTPKTVKLYNNQMILIKEKNYPLNFQDSTTSNSTIPIFDFKSDPKFLELISNRNIDLSSIPNKSNKNNNNYNDESKIKKIKRINVDRSCIYTPLYTDPFSLSFINYSFFKSSFSTYDPDSILKSDEYIQFEKMQNDYYSNIDQLQSISFGNNNNNNNHLDSNKINTNTNNIDNNNNHNNNNKSNNNKNNKNDTTYFHGIDLEDEDTKKTQRPPKCKVN